MEELFIVKDYENNEPTYYYLTDNAEKCIRIFNNIDNEMDFEERVKTFEKCCEFENVKIKDIYIVEVWSQYDE